MKGHIFNLLEKFIVELTDEDTYEKILDSCNFESDDIFIRAGNYPDEDLAEIVQHTTERLGITIPEAHRAFGKWIFPHLVEIAPEEVSKFKHPKPLLLRLDHIHRIKLKKVWPDAKPPEFKCDDLGKGKLLMRYDSPRQMFDLVDGVLASLEDYYSVKISAEKQFIDNGDYKMCDFTIHFDPPGP